MVEKVAKVRALRETFIEDLAGMYEADEMQVEVPVEAPIEQSDVIDVEPEEVTMSDL